MRPCALGRRHALHAMHAGFPAHRAERAVAGHLEHGFLDPAERRRRRATSSRCASRCAREARVHAIEVGREQRRFIAARAGADLDDGVAVVERIARQEQRLELLLDLRDASSRRRRSARASAAISGSSTKTSSRTCASSSSICCSSAASSTTGRSRRCSRPSSANCAASRSAGRDWRAPARPLPRARARPLSGREAPGSDASARLSACRTSGGSARRGQPCRRDAACPCRTGGTPQQTSVWISACVERVWNVLPHAHFTVAVCVFGMDVGFHCEPLGSVGPREMMERRNALAPGNLHPHAAPGFG